MNFKRPVLTLDQFMKRQKVLNLYRQVFRASKGFSLLTADLSKTDRQFVRNWAKEDFKRYKDEKDKDKIDMLLSQGSVQLRTLETSLNLSKKNLPI
ncbi:LYR motif-containing protein 2 [Terramyces sp. JEL0728]|nr:LYR motif-containing protein 2 [Terramyces sp. JEL0728]